jgi:hypothetical protein
LDNQNSPYCLVKSIKINSSSGYYTHETRLFRIKKLHRIFTLTENLADTAFDLVGPEEFFQSFGRKDGDDDRKKVGGEKLVPAVEISDETKSS